MFVSQLAGWLWLILPIKINYRHFPPDKSHPPQTSDPQPQLET